MENINISGTDQTPTVHFCSSGDLSIIGKIIKLNAPRFFSSLICFCNKLVTPEVKFISKLEYVKSSSLKSLFEMFNALEENTFIKTINVEWHYEDGDDRMLEIGKVYSEIFFKLKFEFIACDERVFF